MSVTSSMIRFAVPAISNPALLSLSPLSPKSAGADESNSGKIQVVGRYRTRWFSPGEKYCVSPSFTSRDEDYPDFPVPSLPEPISTKVVESEAEKDVPKRQVVHRWRTESIPIDQPFCLTPLPTGRVIPKDVWSLCHVDLTPPPSLMSVSDEAFDSDQPPTDEPDWVLVYHRSRSQWIRQGDPVAFTPGFHLEEFNRSRGFLRDRSQQFNAPVYVRTQENSPSWAQASAWALAQKSSETPKKE